MMTEIETMLSEIRQFGRPYLYLDDDLPDGPRINDLASALFEHDRERFTCRYCGGHNALECSLGTCAVEYREASSRADGGRSEGT